MHSRVRAAVLPGNIAPIDTRRILNRIIVPRVDRSRLEPGEYYRRTRARSLRECTPRTSGGRATSGAKFRASADTGSFGWPWTSISRVSLAQYPGKVPMLFGRDRYGRKYMPPRELPRLRRWIRRARAETAFLRRLMARVDELHVSREAARVLAEASTFLLTAFKHGQFRSDYGSSACSQALTSGRGRPKRESPHSPQKRRPSRFSAWHLGQTTISATLPAPSLPSPTSTSSPSRGTSSSPW